MSVTSENSTLSTKTRCLYHLQGSRSRFVWKKLFTVY